MNDLRLAWKGEDGLMFLVKAAQCRTCKNFFWYPTAEVAENPNYCPFCGVKFDQSKIDVVESLNDEMAEVLETVRE